MAEPDEPTDEPSDEGDDLDARQREMVERRPEGDERLYTGEPLDTGDGIERPAQQNVGAERERGSGEWPHPRTPPDPAAPGSVSEHDPEPDETTDATDATAPSNED